MSHWKRKDPESQQPLPRSSDRWTGSQGTETEVWTWPGRLLITMWRLSRASWGHGWGSLGCCGIRSPRPANISLTFPLTTFEWVNANSPRYLPQQMEVLYLGRVMPSLSISWIMKRIYRYKILLLSTCLSSVGNSLNTKTQWGAIISGPLDTATSAALLINVEGFHVFIYLFGLDLI